MLTGQWTCTKNLEPQLAMHSLGLKVGKPKPAQQEMMFQDRMIQVGTGLPLPALAWPQRLHRMPLVAVYQAMALEDCREACSLPPFLAIPGPKQHQPDYRVQS